MSRMLAAVAASVALVVPATAHAAQPAGDAVRTLKATPATCAWEVALSKCPARRTKLFHLWGKVVETVDETKTVEIDLEGTGHLGKIQTALAKRLGDTVETRLTATTRIQRIGFDGKKQWINAAGLIETVDEFPRATVYVDARLVAGSTWSDDEPALRATRVVVDLSDLPAPPAGGGLKVEYFKNNALTGTPFATGVDQQIDWNWGAGAPAVLGSYVDDFSIRWSGSVVAPVTGTYQFKTTSDDGVRVLIDGVTVIDNWTEHAATDNAASIDLAAGLHTIQVQYYERGGVTVMKLQWLVPSGSGFVVVPGTALRQA